MGQLLKFNTENEDPSNQRGNITEKCLQDGKKNRDKTNFVSFLFQVRNTDPEVIPSTDDLTNLQNYSSQSKRPKRLIKNLSGPRVFFGILEPRPIFCSQIRMKKLAGMPSRQKI